VLIEAGADRERVCTKSLATQVESHANGQTNVEGEAPEDIDGVGGQEQKNVKAYIVSKVGPRRE
jgi:26S proteasome non-ATPase regulatory subunit 10